MINYLIEHWNYYFSDQKVYKDMRALDKNLSRRDRSLDLVKKS